MFQAHCPVPAEESAESILCVASQIVPALLEKNECQLQAGLRRLQDLGFKRVEWAHQDDCTKAFREYWTKRARNEALLLSSMGPTVCILTSRPREVRATVEEFGAPFIHISETIIDNRGATAQEIPDGR
jgi:beta-RFAP synthase